MYYDVRNRTEQKHLVRAIEIAKTSSCRTRHGAIIAHGPRVLAVATNTDRNSPLICTDPRSEAARHAEWNALRQVRGIDMSKLTLYSARVLRNDTPAMAKPCIRCQDLLDFLGVGRVVWTQGVDRCDLPEREETNDD